MIDKEADKAIKEKSRVVVGATNLRDPVGETHHFVLAATGWLVSKRKVGKTALYLFETALGERTEGPASVFHLT